MKRKTLPEPYRIAVEWVKETHTKGDIYTKIKENTGLSHRELQGNLIDLGEPVCPVCGYTSPEDIWGVSCAKKEEDIKKTHWRELYKTQNSLLERCHIIPHSLGGSDDIFNLYLMCQKCHNLMPNTIYYDDFFIWASVQRSALNEANVMFIDQNKSILEKYPMFSKEFDNFVISKRDDLYFLRKKLGDALLFDLFSVSEGDFYEHIHTYGFSEFSKNKVGLHLQRGDFPTSSLASDVIIMKHYLKEIQ